MKNSSIILIISVLLLAACTPASQTPTPTQTNPTPIVQPPVQEQPSAKPTEQPTPTVIVMKDPFDALPSDTKAIVSSGAAKTADGVAYAYTKLVGGQVAFDRVSQGRMYQRGTTIKIILPGTFSYDRAAYIDEVFLDTAAQTAQGYCKKPSICTTIEQRPAKYADYIYPLPLSWLQGLSNVQSVPAETISGRSTIKLTATKDDQATTIWVDRFSGVPLQVEQGNTQYRYQELSLGVSDNDLKP